MEDFHNQYANAKVVKFPSIILNRRK